LEVHQGEDDLIASDQRRPNVDDLVGAWRGAYKDSGAEPRRGPATTVQGTQSGAPIAAPFLGWPTPREIIRLTTVLRMKDRAKVVGQEGAAALFQDLLSQCGAKLRLLGHSYGCQVCLAGICSEPLDGKRPVESLLLLQPAISAACFAEQVGGPHTRGPHTRGPSIGPTWKH
jgi:hypothetical protein